MRYYCVEPNKNMILKGKEKLKDQKNLRWVLASAEKLPFKDNTLIFMLLALEYEM